MLCGTRLTESGETSLEAYGRRAASKLQCYMVQAQSLITTKHTRKKGRGYFDLEGLRLRCSFPHYLPKARFIKHDGSATEADHKGDGAIDGRTACTSLKDSECIVMLTAFAVGCLVSVQCHTRTTLGTLTS